jgi:hypothetical protein
MSREQTGSSVWAAFEKIAAESNLITPDLKPAQEHIDDRQKDVPTGDDYTRNPKTEEYGVTEGEGKDMVEKAHKEDAQVASAMGKGGLVENVVQQQEKDVEVALKMPDGSLHGVHATVVSDLVKLANSLDESGNEEAAKRVDAAIKEIRNLPFVHSHLRKEAWGHVALALVTMLAPTAISLLTREKSVTKGRGGYKKVHRGPMKMRGGKVGWIATAVGSLMALLPNLTSIKDGLTTDLKELHDILADVDDSNAAADAARKLAPFMSSLKQDLTTEAGIKKYVTAFNKLRTVVTYVESNIAKMKLEKGESHWLTFGLGEMSRVEAKFDDFKSSFEDAKELLKKVVQTGTQAEAVAQQEMASSVPALDNLSIGDELDKETVQELTNLEKQLTEELADDISKAGKPYDFTGKFVSGGKLVIDPKTLSRIVDLAGEVNRRNR